MPRDKKEKLLCVDDLRHSEYYAMQETFDNLYAKSKAGEKFTDLMSIILCRENILLAYRNIKANSGSNTPGTDDLSIKDIGRLSPEAVVERVNKIIHGKNGYTPRPVRRKNIPKAGNPTKTRPLGIPCIWDRLIQQCIKQVMEPICEAKFSPNSYGFRPERSVENAISRTYYLMQMSHMHYVIEFDIKGFFDNVNHSKLIRQIWALGIQDKHLLYIIRQTLKAPIWMPDGTTVHPEIGTPQGGIISPLLANIVLNELDHWIDSQWQNNPVTQNYKARIRASGAKDLGHAYRAMRETKLKEMYIVRYADDFRIFCRTRKDAVKTMQAVTQWLQERLKLEISPEKTRIVNVKRKYSEFLGFKIRVHLKGKKYVVKSNMCDKAMESQKAKLTKQAKQISQPRKNYGEAGEIRLYNAMVMGMQNYYRIATNISSNASEIAFQVNRVLYNRFATQRGNRLVKHGRKLTDTERARYGHSAQLRFIAGSDEPVYPVGYVRYKTALPHGRATNRYTPEGRIGLHDNLRLKTGLMMAMMLQPCNGRSAEYADNRISLYSVQWGKCAVTGAEFTVLSEIHCHHIRPIRMGGTDKYSNLVLLSEPVHRLIHATQDSTIQHYCEVLNLSSDQLERVNHYRERAGNVKI